MNAVLGGKRKVVKLSNCLIVVLSGNAWITCEKGAGDIILSAGRKMKLRGGGWVAQGLPGCELQYRTWPILQ